MVLNHVYLVLILDLVRILVIFRFIQGLNDTIFTIVDDISVDSKRLWRLRESRDLLA